MITIVTTSSCGKRKRTSLLEGGWRGRRFEIGQMIETSAHVRWPISAGQKGKIVGFNRPNGNGRTSAVLKVLLDGEKRARDLGTNDIQIIPGK